jgi:hypothetical protein
VIISLLKSLLSVLHSSNTLVCSCGSIMRAWRRMSAMTKSKKKNRVVPIGSARGSHTSLCEE